MSSILSTHKNNTKAVPTTSYLKFVTHTGVAMAIAILALSIVGCSTTQEFKPTASVIVGAHKSL